jgi:hypothetical protein
VGEGHRPDNSQPQPVAASDRPASAALRVRRRVLWLLALPHLGVLAIGGLWAETPRLVTPLVLGEALLAIGAAPRAYHRNAASLKV